VKNFKAAQKTEGPDMNQKVVMGSMRKQLPDVQLEEDAIMRLMKHHNKYIAADVLFRP